MPTFHGGWLGGNRQGFFVLWGETWRSVTIQPEQYPYAVKAADLAGFLRSQGDGTQIGQELEIQATLPSQKIKRRLTPVLSERVPELAAAREKLTLSPWQISAVQLSIADTAKLFQALPLQPQPNLGPDLCYWGQVYRWGLDLLVRSKFLPSVSADQDALQGHWQLLLDSTDDLLRLAKFVQRLPAICNSYRTDIYPAPEPTARILSFLNAIADYQLRHWTHSFALSHPENTGESWLTALSSPEGQWSADAKGIAQMTIALEHWQFPIADYLVTETPRLGDNLFQLCLTLTPPIEGRDDWQLNYGLTTLDQPQNLITAEQIWQTGESELIWQGRTLENPQETLLKSLGLAARFYAPIAQSLETSQPTDCQVDPLQVYEFIRGSARQLRDSGVSLRLPPGLDLGSRTQRLGIQINASVPNQKRLGFRSLLEYDLQLSLGERAISAEEFEGLLDQRSPLVQIDDQWVALQPTDVKAAQDLYQNPKAAVELTVEDALRLSTGETQSFFKLPVMNFEPTGELKEFIVAMTDKEGLPEINPPKGFKGDLRTYQSRGVSWLTFLERWGLGACLADDMGLGKTIQLIAFVLCLRERLGKLKQPILIVSPTSVISNWEREIHRFAPTLSTFVFHGSDRPKGKTFVREIKGKEMILTSYSIVQRDEKTLSQINWEGIVLDEAQNIKNPLAKQSQAVRKLPAEFRIALTGTPVENRLSELWSILDFLNPSYLGSKEFFQRRFALPIEKYGDRDSLNTLRGLVRPFILRRLKSDRSIIQDLPEKQEMNVFCSLSPEQAEQYAKLTNDYLSQIEVAEGIKRRGLILTLILKLKQLCNHPELIKSKKYSSTNFGPRSGKLQRLQEMLSEITTVGDRALIFTQFSEWGKMLQPFLQSTLGEKVFFLYGATKREQRQAMVEQFQNDPNAPKIFVLSLKAGGTGLNLTRANHVFHVDRWWNPAVENQATDRAFRIGQKRNVQVHKFVCSGTLEEKISALIESKQQLAEQTVDAGEQWLTELDTDQLRELLLLERDAVIGE